MRGFGVELHGDQAGGAADQMDRILRAELVQRLPESHRLQVVTSFADAIAAAREIVTRHAASRSNGTLAAAVLG